jgi:hypothetical protein
MTQNNIIQQFEKILENFENIYQKKYYLYLSPSQLNLELPIIEIQTDAGLIEHIFIPGKQIFEDIVKLNNPSNEDSKILIKLKEYYRYIIKIFPEKSYNFNSRKDLKNFINKKINTKIIYDFNKNTVYFSYENELIKLGSITIKN